MAQALNSIIELKPTIISPAPDVDKTFSVTPTKQADAVIQDTIIPQALIQQPAITSYG